MNDPQKPRNEIVKAVELIGQEPTGSAVSEGFEAQNPGQNRNVARADLAADTMHLAEDALDAGRAYAQGAVDSTGRRLSEAKSQFTATAERLTRAINEEPVKAVFIAAAVSSILTAVVVIALRSERQY